MKLRTVLKLVSLFIFTGKAYSQVLYIQDGNPAFVQVDKYSGATLQFPLPVKMVPVMPKYTDIKPQRSNQESDYNNQKQKADDVTVFSIPPNLKKPDSAVFLLANGKSLLVNFIPAVSQVSDAFYQIKYIRNSNSNFYASNSKYFLSDEKDLMVSMLKDDEKFGRKKENVDIDFKEYPEISFKVVRAYEANKLQGYVFKIRNNLKNEISINPTILKIGNPNRIVMIQNDHDVLDSCDKNADASPTGTGCYSILRIVMRSDTSVNDLATLKNSKMPFVVNLNKDEKGRQ